MPMSPVATNGLPNLEDPAVSLGAADLLDLAIERHEGRPTADRALVVETGSFTGRSPDDKFIVDEPWSRDGVWWGRVNQPMSDDHFDLLSSDVSRYLADRPTIRQDLAVGADPAWQVPIQLVTERAWVALFARHLFIVPEGRSASRAQPITILHAPGFLANPDRHGTGSSTVIAINLARRQIIIAGTEYAGEVKKSVFSLMQYLLPRLGVLTMHCSANIPLSGDRPTLFFGLSGTGKTTLSNAPDRLVVGDDEHAWSDHGIFNLEGGCYAKTLDLSETDEPAIYRATARPGTILENVLIDPRTANPDFADRSLTENTRAAFPLSALENAAPSGTAGHPAQIVLLTADATGVLPPVARLTREQAASLFLLGFTSRLAGTERGLSGPELTFSPCFGGPFLVLPPETYARMLVERIDRHQPSLWLVNTGWTGGSPETGHRISIETTRAIVSAITEGALDHVAVHREPALGLSVPASVPDVPDEALHPRDAWDDTAAYERQAAELRAAFRSRIAEYQVDPSWSAWLGPATGEPAATK